MKKVRLGIQCDNCKGGRIATKYLIDCGCKKLLHFSRGIDEEMPAENREKAYIYVMKGILITLLRNTI